MVWVVWFLVLAGLFQLIGKLHIFLKVFALLIGALLLFLIVWFIFWIVYRLIVHIRNKYKALQNPEENEGQTERTQEVMQQRETLKKYLDKNGLGMEIEQQIDLFHALLGCIYDGGSDLKQVKDFTEDVFNAIANYNYPYGIDRLFILKSWIERQKTINDLLFSEGFLPIHPENMRVDVFNDYFTFSYVDFKNNYIKKEFYKYYFDFDYSNPSDGVYIRKFEKNNYCLEYQERECCYLQIEITDFDEFIDCILKRFYYRHVYCIEHRGRVLSWLSNT